MFSRVRRRPEIFVSFSVTRFIHARDTHNAYNRIAETDNVYISVILLISTTIVHILAVTCTHTVRQKQLCRFSFVKDPPRVEARKKCTHSIFKEFTKRRKRGGWACFVFKRDTEGTDDIYIQVSRFFLHMRLSPASKRHPSLPLFTAYPPHLLS